MLMSLFSYRPGFQTHAAAEASVLLAQGRAPTNLSPGKLAHFRAEQAVLANQQNHPNIPGAHNAGLPGSAAHAAAEAAVLDLSR